MIALVFGVGIICIIMLVKSCVSILHKVSDGRDTGRNVFICCITLIYLWISTIMLCAI